MMTVEMDEESGDKKEEPRWRKQFIEIAVRAIWKTHLNYLPWNIGNPWHSESPDADKLNQGLGIELADEVSVCSMITQEFLLSPLVSGASLRGEHCFWRVHREIKYENDSSLSVDLCIERFELGKSRKPQLNEEKHPPAFVEAKRAYGWVTKLGGNPPSPGSCNAGSVATDVDKLITERDFRKKNSKDFKYGKNELRTSVLVWGYWSKENEMGTSCPKVFFENVNKKCTKGKVEVKELRSIPLIWDQYSLQNDTFDPTPSVTRWLWVALAEVNPK